MVPGPAAVVMQNLALVGAFEGATHCGTVGEPGEGAFVRIWLRIDSERINRATFLTHGCPSSQAASAMTVTLAGGRTLEQAARITGEDVRTVLGGLPEGKGHFADMAVEALQKAMRSKL
jgi:nitrogen fixation NifU-like protein